MLIVCNVPLVQHTVDRVHDKFASSYRQSRNSKNSDSRNKLCRIELPHIRLIQRLKDILNESPSRSMTFRQLIQTHHRKWPQYKTHEPTSKAINIRFKSTFHIWDEDVNGRKEQMIKLKYVCSVKVSLSHRIP